MIMTLVACGFGYREIMDEMTIDEVALFYQASYRHQNKKTLEEALTIRNAHHADGEGFEKFMKLFSKPDDDKKEIAKPGEKKTIEKFDKIKRLLDGRG